MHRAVGAAFRYPSAKGPSKPSLRSEGLKGGRTKGLQRLFEGKDEGDFKGFEGEDEGEELQKGDLKALKCKDKGGGDSKFLRTRSKKIGSKKTKQDLGGGISSLSSSKRKLRLRKTREGGIRTILHSSLLQVSKNKRN